MKQKVKKKKNPFLIITGLLLIIIVGAFTIKLLYFTAKESDVVLDTYSQKTTVSTATNIDIPTGANTEEKGFSYRKNWKEFIYIPPLHKDVEFEITKDGKVTKLNIPVVNKTEYSIESITIKIYYIDPSNRNSIDSRILEIKNIPSNNRNSFKAPDSNAKGLSVLCDIIKVKSKNFGFCYDEEILKDAQSAGGLSGDPKDPWHCK
jgi:hypothetical protein